MAELLKVSKDDISNKMFPDWMLIKTEWVSNGRKSAYRRPGIEFREDIDAKTDSLVDAVHSSGYAHPLIDTLIDYQGSDEK